MSEIKEQEVDMTNIDKLNLNGVEIVEDPLIVDFGKYKGKSIVEFSKTDFGYCKWLASQPSVSDEIKEYINNNVNVNDYIMRWGRHKNKSVSFIKANDAKYAKWLINNQYVIEKCPKLLEALKNI
jgi:hypothetical protein